LLILRNGRPVDREWLARTLWPEADLTQALANLRPALSQLRNALGEQSYRIGAPDRRTLRLDLDGAFADVVAFDRAIASSRAADLEAAVNLYRGPLLQGCTEDWVFQERDSREQKCVQALVRLGEIAALAGDSGLAAERYRQAVVISPLADAPRRGLMEALARSGDRNGALDAYRQFAVILRAEINAEPDEATSRLYDQLRRQMREEGRGAAPQPERPKLAGSLPHPVANFVGREEERSQVSSEIRRRRLITLVGPGGIGKTRLAVETALEIASEFPDGAWLVALEALSNDELLERQIASVFGLPEEPNRPLSSILADFLKTKRLLIVLDNCEHILRTCARFVESLLRECAGVKILATSRESLGLSGERIWSVPTLPFPDLDHLPGSPTTRRRVLAGYESVELFVERATAVNRHFTLSASNATSVAEICAYLEGMPLAIELAAARTKAMKVEEIARRLGDGLGLLSGGRNLPVRQRTLRATLDWSYGLLTVDERRIFRRLSIFVGGWTLAVAERVVAGGEINEGAVLDLIESLVDKSLVWFDHSRGRYRLSEPVRQYAEQEREASDDSEPVMRAHTEWCIEFAEEADARLRGRDHRQWMGELLDERDNLRSALNRNIGLPEGLRLAAALGRFWRTHGDCAEGRRYISEALAHASHAPDPIRAKAFARLGALCLAQSDFAKADEYLGESLKLGDAGSLTLLGKVAHEQGDDVKALLLVEDGIANARGADAKPEIVVALMTWGEIMFLKASRSAQIEVLSESLSLCRELEDEIGIATNLSQLGDISLLSQDFLTARSHYLEAEGIFRALGDRRGIALTQFGLAHVANWAEEYGEAVKYWNQALEIHQALGDRRGIVLALAFLGRSEAMMGALTEAKEHICQSLSLSQSLSSEGRGITSIESLIPVLLGLDRFDLAAQLMAYSDLQREAIQAKRGPSGAAAYARHLDVVCAGLEPEAFQREWNAGKLLTDDLVLKLMSSL